MKKQLIVLLCVFLFSLSFSQDKSNLNKIRLSVGLKTWSFDILNIFSGYTKWDSEWSKGSRFNMGRDYSKTFQVGPVIQVCFKNWTASFIYFAESNIDIHMYYRPPIYIEGPDEFDFSLYKEEFEFSVGYKVIKNVDIFINYKSINARMSQNVTWTIENPNGFDNSLITFGYGFKARCDFKKSGFFYFGGITSYPSANWNFNLLEYNSISKEQEKLKGKGYSFRLGFGKILLKNLSIKSFYKFEKFTVSDEKHRWDEFNGLSFEALYSF